VTVMSNARGGLHICGRTSLPHPIRHPKQLQQPFAHRVDSYWKLNMSIISGTLRTIWEDCGVYARHKSNRHSGSFDVTAMCPRLKHCLAGAALRRENCYGMHAWGGSRPRSKAFTALVSQLKQLPKQII